MKTLLIPVAVVLLFGGTIAAQSTEYYYVQASGLHKKTNQLYAFVSDVLPVTFDKNGTSNHRTLDTVSRSLSNQFSDWLKAYCRQITGLDSFTIDLKTVALGPYDSRAEAVSDRRRTLGNLGAKFRLTDLPATTLPTFRDEEGQ